MWKSYECCVVLRCHRWHKNGGMYLYTRSRCSPHSLMSRMSLSDVYLHAPPTHQHTLRLRQYPKTEWRQIKAARLALIKTKQHQRTRSKETKNPPMENKSAASSLGWDERGTHRRRGPPRAPAPPWRRRGPPPPPPRAPAPARSSWAPAACAPPPSSSPQSLTLLHFSAQLTATLRTFCGMRWVGFQ